MSILEELFISPELYPLKIDFQRQSVSFVRMSRRAYQSALFASFRGAARFGGDAYEIRLDDVLLAARSVSELRRTHYILHTAYCCSTLLARCFELLPLCFVLKEPPLLAQVATTTGLSQARWNEVFDLSVRLLTRTFGPNDIAVIKTHVPCNIIGPELLEHNPRASITFLMTPLRSFVLAVLKSQARQERIRTWNQQLTPLAPFPELAEVAVNELSPAQSAVYWWHLSRLLYQHISSGPHGQRVSLLNGEELADGPERFIDQLINSCGLTVDRDQLSKIQADPSLRAHSKHPAREFDASDLHKEMAALDEVHGQDVDKAMNWALLRGLDCTFPNSKK